jgi:hypothetical protein
MMEEIGETSGKIWKTLSEKGEMPITRLRKASDLGPTLFLLGLGWLAREGKVAFRNEGRFLRCPRPGRDLFC